MLYKAGTTPRERRHFNRCMDAGPDVIYSFPRSSNGDFDVCLHTVHEDDTGARVRKLDPRVQPIYLLDPCKTMPWDAQDLHSFKEYATRAVKDLADGKTVLVTCVGGKNRSRAFCRAVVRLAKTDGVNVDVDGDMVAAEDPDLERVVDTIDDDEALAALAPVGVTRAKRQRGA